MELHKYSRVDKWLLASLNEGTIHFNCPIRYNDPFDCYINLTVGDNEEYWKKLEGQHPNDEIKIIKKAFLAGSKNPIIQHKILQDIRISCFSESDNDLLMWGHYADCHKGICLKFETLLKETNALLFDENDFHINYVDSPSKPLLLYKVNYSKEMPKAGDYFSFDEEDLIKFISTKAQNWHYENEWRVLADAKNMKSDNPRYLDKQLNAIIFGMNCPPSDIDLIKRLTSHRKIKYLKAQISSTEYKVEILPE